MYIYLYVFINAFTYTPYIHKSIRHFDIICIMYLNFSIPKHLVNRHYTHSFINVLRSYIHLKYTCIIYKI